MKKTQDFKTQDAREEECALLSKMILSKMILSCPNWGYREGLRTLRTKDFISDSRSSMRFTSVSCVRQRSRL